MVVLRTSPPQWVAINQRPDFVNISQNDIPDDNIQLHQHTEYDSSYRGKCRHRARERLGKVIKLSALVVLQSEAWWPNHEEEHERLSDTEKNWHSVRYDFFILLFTENKEHKRVLNEYFRQT